MVRKEFVVPADRDGVRASDLLRVLLPDLHESAVRRLFDARDVKLDGVRVSRDAPVRAGQCVTVFLPEEKAAAPALDIVYEDDDVLLVNKRAGISVERDALGGITLTDLCAGYVRLSDPGAPAPAACHRLDNRTCGLCLFAKTPEALAVLQDVFRRRTLEKKYICLVRGMMKPPEAVCSAWLVKDARRARVRVTDRPEPDAKPIRTGYSTLEAGPVSRLSVHLYTGRTHQIRAHLAALGHPVLGDDLYGDRDFNRRYRARSLKLCAVSLKLETGGLLPRLDGQLFTIEPPF